MLQWKRIEAGEYISVPENRFFICSVYNRAEGGDVWKLVDGYGDPDKPYFRDTLRDCRALAENIIKKERGEMRTIELTEDMF